MKNLKKNKMNYCDFLKLYKNKKKKLKFSFKKIMHCFNFLLNSIINDQKN